MYGMYVCMYKRFPVKGLQTGGSHEFRAVVQYFPCSSGEYANAVSEGFEDVESVVREKGTI